MIRKKIFGIVSALILSISVIIVGCDSTTTATNGSDTMGNMGTLKVKMHDAPANYDSVNVSIKSVEVKDTSTDTGWVKINSPQKTFNLLELTNGASAVLGSKELPAGTYEQIRLILNKDGNSVVVDGTKHNLFIPSGAQTGIKLNINAEIKPDITYTLLLDFDAARSIVETGNQHSQHASRYLLKPVIRATNQAETGNISGAIKPVDAKPFIYAISDSDTLSSTKADTTDGSFKLVGLKEGNYTVSVEPADTTAYQTKDTTGVAVTIGETNDIGTLTLSQK